MPAVNEAIVREYFEALGYLVSQPCKYVGSGRKKAEEEMDFLVAHPLIAEHRVPEHVIWNTPDLRTVARAIVSVRGWHTERFSAATFEKGPELLRFGEPAVRRLAAARIGSPEMATILCFPQLPVSGELKDKTLRVLKEKGIDGVLTFRTMLDELVARVDTNRNYEKSDLLQTLRILKKYGLVKDTQMDLFTGKRRRARAKPPAPAA